MSPLRKVQDAESGPALDRLAEQVQRELAMIDHAADWVKPHFAPDGSRALDVAIVGGGQSGLGAAFGLIREGVRNILIVDENEPGFEGPWATYARMLTLRTPKHIAGLELGVPSLSFRAWWEAQVGAEGWDALDKIPREDWMRYLRWYRAALKLPVVNRARVTGVTPLTGLFRLDIAGADPIFARKVVMATGIQGGGEWHTPPLVQALPRRMYAHTSEAIDFAALKGKTVAVLGGGASAFDNAQYALGKGVGEVHVFVRRKQLPQVNPIRYMEKSGIVRHFAGLDDARKYRAIRHFLLNAQPPTNDTFARACAYPGFALHLGSPWLAVEQVGDQARVTTPKGQFLFDFLILSTGLRTDLQLRPELAAVAGDIALWRDRYRPPADLAEPLIDEHPYLGPGFEFTARAAEAEARVRGLFAFNYSALASLGLSASALSGLKVALPRLVEGVSRQLFLDDQDALIDDYVGYDEPEFQGRWPAD
jgi:cation diffusion facilitator CzcD-associated flavoprotein CzcO